MLRTECSDILQNDSFPPLNAKDGGILLCYLLWGFGWAPGSTSHGTVGALQWLGPLGIFHSQTSPHGASFNSSVTAQNWFLQRSPLLSLCSCSGSHDILYLSLHSGRQGFALCFLLSHRSKKSFWFFSCVYLLLGWCGDFQASYMWNGRETRNLSQWFFWIN